MRQVIRFNPNCIARVRAVQTKPAPALRTDDSPEKPPTRGGQGNSLNVFRTRHHKFGEKRVQIGRVHPRVTLREKRCVHHSTAALLPALPNAIESDMILKISADTRQMLHDRYAYAM